MHLTEEEILTALADVEGGEQREHLRRCGVCRSKLREWQELLRLLGDAQSDPVRGNEVRQLKAMLREFGPKRRSTVWMAKLLRTNGLVHALDGARGFTGPQFLEYSSEHYWVSLEVGPLSPGRSYIHGDVTAKDSRSAPPSHAVFYGAPDVVLTVPVDENGEFHFSSVSEGLFGMTLLLPEGEIRLPDVGTKREKPDRSV